MPLHSFVRKLTDYSNQNSFGSKMRKRRIRILLSILEEIYERKGRVKIIDFGGTREYWNILPENLWEDYNLHITIVNLSGAIKSIQNTERIYYKEGDCCSLTDFQDQSFDLVHSNSVIEHVGMYGRRENFIREMLRMAPYYYLQTPDFAFPLEPHFMFPFFHYLPLFFRVWLIQRMDIGQFKRADTSEAALEKINGINLLSRNELKKLLPNAKIIRERFLGLSKSLIAVPK